MPTKEDASVAGSRLDRERVTSPGATSSARKAIDRELRRDVGEVCPGFRKLQILTVRTAGGTRSREKELTLRAKWKTHATNTIIHTHTHTHSIGQIKQ